MGAKEGGGVEREGRASERARGGACASDLGTGRTSPSSTISSGSPLSLAISTTRSVASSESVRCRSASGSRGGSLSFLLRYAPMRSRRAAEGGSRLASALSSRAASTSTNLPCTSGGQ